ncbi:Potassium transporter 5 [Morella rubra]|uniref:Potassium transporter 5 n=1 Tax=Morella rubra TaxID=262757 RepID=A0A6A1UTE4_9ROSI|nr:Potassium transporter 5 [Morella rubra]KAB1203088.1 Potassium transporter 5 [Morella rubra]
MQKKFHSFHFKNSPWLASNPGSASGYTKVSLIPNQQAEDCNVSTYKLELLNRHVQRASWLKSTLEKSNLAKILLLFGSMLGTSMVIGDGVLTPCISGTEALFADFGHFSVPSIKISMSCLTYPAIILAYTGQASFLRKHNDVVGDVFFSSIPGKQCLSIEILTSSNGYTCGRLPVLANVCRGRIGCDHSKSSYDFWDFLYNPTIPRTRVFPPAVTLGFRTTAKIGNAYGIAVVFVMTLTAAFLVLVMILIWKWHLLLVISYILVIGSVELIYLSSTLYKFDQGGYLPLAFAAVLMTVMYVWNYVFRKKYHYELQNKISGEKLKEITAVTSFSQMPSLALFYSELVHGIPPIFKHYVANVPALPSVLIFVSFKSLPISKVPVQERFLSCRVGPKELNMFHCVVRYGYTDAHDEQEPLRRS